MLEYTETIAAAGLISPKRLNRSYRVDGNNRALIGRPNLAEALPTHAPLRQAPLQKGNGGRWRVTG
jgi:hypothetical protein